MTNIENKTFRITIGTAIACVGYMVYASWLYGQWTQKIENRMEKMEISQSIVKTEAEKDRTIIRNLEDKMASQDVTLAEIKKDVSQILFEIRKK